MGDSLNYPELIVLQDIMTYLKDQDRQTVDRLLEFLRSWNKARPAPSE